MKRHLVDVPLLIPICFIIFILILLLWASFLLVLLSLASAKLCTVNQCFQYSRLLYSNQLPTSNFIETPG